MGIMRFENAKKLKYQFEFNTKKDKYINTLEIKSTRSVG